MLINFCRQLKSVSMKSALSQYIAIAALLGNHGDELELWCDSKDDEQYFFDFFNHNPEVI